MSRFLDVALKIFKKILICFLIFQLSLGYVLFDFRRGIATNLYDPLCNRVVDPQKSYSYIQPQLDLNKDACIYNTTGRICAPGYTYYDLGSFCLKTPPDCPQVNNVTTTYSSSLKKCVLEVPKPGDYKENATLFLCTKKCYDLRIDSKVEGLPGEPIPPPPGFSGVPEYPSMRYNWVSTTGGKNITIRIKKGIFLSGILRPYGNGCFVRGDSFSMCFEDGGSSLTFRFSHPNKGDLILKGRLLSKWYNQFYAFISPEIMGLQTISLGSSSREFVSHDLGYAPIDNDSPHREMVINVTLSPLNNDPLEIISLSFESKGGTVPFCPENGYAMCYKDMVTFISQYEGKPTQAGRGNPSTSNTCSSVMFSIAVHKGTNDSKGMVYSFRNRGNNLYVEEVSLNTSNLMVGNSLSPVSYGICSMWQQGSTVGITQKKVENNVTEEYGYFIEQDLSFSNLGFLRKSTDYVGTIYLGRESNRQSSWRRYSVPFGFYKGYGVSPSAPGTNEVLTDDGIFRYYSELCPSGQVELYNQVVYIPGGSTTGTGRCYSYVEPANCYLGSYAGYDEDRLGDYCYLQIGVPTVCSYGGHLLTPPSDNYRCELTAYPYCGWNRIRLGSHCYDYRWPSLSYCYSNCASCYTCVYTGGGICQCNVRESYYTWDWATNGTCPTLDGCSLDYQYYDWCYYYCTREVTTSSSACPPGYWYHSGLNLCLTYVGSACSYTYDYDSLRDICYYRYDASCSNGFRATDPDTGYAACYVLNSYVGPGSNFPSRETGRIYCRNGLHYYADRCYQYRGIGCSGSYRDDLVILGSGNWIGEWTGQCWMKVRDDSPTGENALIVRKPHYLGSDVSLGNEYAYLTRSLDSVKAIGTEVSIPDFTSNVTTYLIGRHLLGQVTSSTNRIKDDTVAKIYLGRGDKTSTCPLDPNAPCSPFAGGQEICALSRKACALCTEGDPPKIDSNPTLFYVYRIRERPNKVFGLFRQEFNYIAAQEMIKNIPMARLPTNAEVGEIRSAFSGSNVSLGSFWTQESIAAERDYQTFRQLVVVMSPSYFGFAAECLFGDDLNMVCAADMVLCNNNVCPLGNYRCIPVRGIRYCSKYSERCTSLANLSHEIEEFDSAPEGPPPGEIDQDRGCLGQLYIFPGTAMRCRPPGLYTGPNDCCSDNIVKEENVPKESFGGSPGSMLGFASKLGTTTVSIISQYVWSLYKIRNGIQKFSSDLVSGPLGVKQKVVTVVTADGRELKFFGDTAEMLEVAYNKGAISTLSTDVDWAKAITEGLTAYFGSAEFAFNVLSTASSFFVRDPYAQGLINVAVQALKVWLFNASPIGIATAIAGLIVTYLMMTCDAQDYQTVAWRRARRCVEIGTFCITRLKILNVCLQRGKRYCCFNSIMARIIHEQGRPQLAKFGYSQNWGRPESPNCRGFTPEEFQALDFGKIDFSEYIAEIEKEVVQKFEAVKEKVYEGMGKTLQDVPGVNSQQLEEQIRQKLQQP